MTIKNKNGSMKRYRKDALHNQLPPESSIERFSTNVKAKKNDEQIPNIIARKATTSVYYDMYEYM
jgi:hypothetical protein